MRTLYSLAIGCYTLVIRLASPFHPKARQMVQGWRRSLHALENCASDSERQPLLWFHASSLGEFEQARPVLEQLRADHPGHRICITFFSPSGYEVRREYPFADLVMYLPPDTRRNARRLVENLRPGVVFFVKYDFWFNYLDALQRKHVPVYIFSAIFRPSHYFFKPYGKWFREQLKRCFTHIFVQNQESLQLLRNYGINQCSRAGDTRFDRVKAIADGAQPNPAVERFARLHKDCTLLIAGSSWPPDERLLQRYMIAQQQRPLCLVLAPHVINASHLDDIVRLFGKEQCVRYSRLEHVADEELARRSVLVVDNIGMLASLYRYARTAYIGGGWGHGIHNILEAVTFGKPVLFGPNHKKFQEAKDILACGGGFAHCNYEELEAQLNLLLDDNERYRAASDACLRYVAQNIGSTQTILANIHLPEQ
ncbi:MAG: 3-deoxy-D-manno-octulosonic-acid transferase [bacterium F083]|nr:MAG: 3-deoxy-D-manno-octulosonic-acid transferase [bacterium F083]